MCIFVFDFLKIFSYNHLFITFSLYFYLFCIYVFIAKGRTNVELREQFTLASGVSQSMTPFKTRASQSSPNSSVSGGQKTSQSYPTTGPITKVNKSVSCWFAV